MASISATTVAIAAMVSAAASAGVSAYSANEQGKNAKRTGEFNAEMQRRTADDALQRGAIDAADKRQQTRQLIARQHAAQAASGLDTTSGTPLQIMTESAGMGELDALRTLNNAQRQASGLNASADLEIYKGNAAQSAGRFNAAGSILTGASSAAQIGYYGMKPGSTYNASKPNGEFT
jgi:hypothetical protein